MTKPKPIYLDYAAATPVDPRVLRVMAPYASKTFGNPGSLHRAGAEALKALDGAREVFSNLLGADFRNIIFTASATEANNLALRGVVKRSSTTPLRGAVRGYRVSGIGNRVKNSLPPSPYPLCPKIIVSAIEHESVLETARDMERAGEVEVTVLPVDREGVVDLTALAAALDERTVLVSVMYVNNEVGSVQPISEIARITNSYKLKTKSFFPLLHTDAAQAFNHYPCDVKALGADLMTLSSQKIYGPKGAGALALGNREWGVGSRAKRKGVSTLLPTSYPLRPILTGGGQEFGLRAGTENVPAIVGFAAAAEIAARERSRVTKSVQAVRDAFVKELARRVPGITVNHPPRERSAPHIVNIAFPGVSSEDLLVLFDRAGIAASPGAACSARALTLSHVLLAMGFPEERVRRSIRFSFGRGATVKEAHEAARRIGEAIGSLSRAQPL